MFCTSCGSPNPDAAVRCSACGALLLTPPDLEPVVSVPPLVAGTGPTPASAIAAPPAPTAIAPTASVDRIVAGHRVATLGDRLIALILDTILLLAVFAVVGMWAGTRWGGITTSGFALAGTGALVTLSIMAVVGFIYYWLCEALVGVTLGKGIAGIKVINEQGTPSGLGASMIRNIMRIIDGLFIYLVGYLVAIFSRMRKRLGDHLARTYVVEKELGALHRVLLVVLWIVLLVAGIWGAIAIHGPGILTAGGTPSGGTGADHATRAGTSNPSGRVVSNEATFTIPSRSTGDLKLVNFTFTTEKEGPPRPDGPYKTRG